MHDVLQNCDSLEESVKVIPSSNYLKSPNLTQPLSNLGTLSLDSMSRMEQTNSETEEVEEIDLYQHTMHAIGRMHRYRGKQSIYFYSHCLIFILDFAICGDQILQSRALKRSSYPHAHPNSKKSRPINTSHCLQKDAIHKIILNVTRNLELKSVIKSLGGHHRVLQVIIGRTMFVHIILRGLNIDRVFVRGIDEEDNLDGEDHKYNKNNFINDFRIGSLYRITVRSNAFDNYSCISSSIIFLLSKYQSRTTGTARSKSGIFSTVAKVSKFHSQSAQSS